MLKDEFCTHEAPRCVILRGTLPGCFFMEGSVNYLRWIRGYRAVSFVFRMRLNGNKKDTVREV